MIAIIHGLFDNTIVFKSAKYEKQVKLGSDLAARGFTINFSDGTLFYVRFAGGVWSVTTLSTGYYFQKFLPPDISGRSPRIVEGMETSNFSFVAVFKEFESAQIENRHYSFDE